MVIKKRKRNKSPGIDQIPVELIKSGGRIFRSEIHKLNNSIRNKEELPEDWKELIIVRSFRKGDKTGCSNRTGMLLCQLRTKFLQHPPVKVNSISRGNYW
jgi:hypothetical protein